MKQKWTFLFSIIPGILMALPESFEVVSGEAHFAYPNEKTLVIEVKDRTILEERSFSIAKGEKVQFVQPSSASSVLNRVKGQDPSTILGQISSNGRVFLVNPNGVYFGPDAIVNVGSFLVSTLDIANQDFLSDNYIFRKGSLDGEIVNFGTLQAEGSIALLSSKISNAGTILAKIGTALLSSEEAVTISFTEDNLMEFAVEEKLTQEIGNLQGYIELRRDFAKQAIRNVINTDEIEVATSLVKEGDIIRLIDTSKISAKEVCVEGGKGSSLIIEGKIDGSKVHLIAENITVSCGEINVCMNQKGGDVLIGSSITKTLTVESSSSILADALEEGKGGNVLLWSEEVTSFDGKILSRGGRVGGDGGLVETSSAGYLHSQTGSVDTSAQNGNRGTWMLDPSAITVVEGGDLVALSKLKDRGDLSSLYTVSPVVFESSMSNVLLSAPAEDGRIEILSPIYMKQEGVGLTLSVNEDSGMIFLQNNIFTQGGPIRCEGPVFLGKDGRRILDTAKGNKGEGASIIFEGPIDGISHLELYTGSKGIVEFKDKVGALSPIQNLRVEGRRLTLADDVVTASGQVEIFAPIALKGHAKIDTTAKGESPLGAPIILKGSVNGTYKLSLESGSEGGIFADASMGETTALAVVHMKGSHISLNSNMTASGGTMIFDGPVSIRADLALTDTGPTGILFLGTVNSSGGSFSLTLEAPVGRVSFLDEVGSAAPLLSNVTISSNLVQLKNDLHITNDLTIDGPIQLLGDVGISSASIDFLQTVDGSYDLSLDVGSSGSITIANRVGSEERVNILTFVNADTITTQGIYAEGILQIDANTSTFAEFLDTTGSSGISLTGGAFSLGGGIQTLNGGGVTLINTATVTTSTALDAKISGSFTQTGTGSLNLAGTFSTANQDISIASDIELIGPLSFNTGSSGAGALTLNGAVNGSYPLSLVAGMGDIELNGSLGNVTALGDVTIYSVKDISVENVEALSFSQLGGFGTGTYLGDMMTTGSLGIYLTSTYLNFAGTVGGKTLRSINGNMVINSIYSSINSNANPVLVAVNNGTNGTLFVGSSNAGYFSDPGTTIKLLGSVRSNIPCFVRYNEIDFSPQECPIPVD